MTPISLILLGFAIAALTVWDVRRKEADMLFWMDLLWWDVNKTENPILFRIAVTLQFLVALIIILIGATWLLYF